MRTLGLDWGKVRIGVAVTDPLNMTAQPLEFINNDKEYINTLNGLIKKYGINLIVIGLPRGLRGHSGGSAESAKSFSKEIEKKTGIKTVLWDERLTTKEAERSLLKANISGKRRKKLIDSASAALLLSNYMAFNRSLIERKEDV